MEDFTKEGSAFHVMKWNRSLSLSIVIVLLNFQRLKIFLIPYRYCGSCNFKVQS